MNDLSKTAAAKEMILDILDAEGDQESDALDARVAEATGLAAATVQNLRGDLGSKGAGLIRSRAEKAELGTVTKWFVCRTNAPRTTPHDEITLAETQEATLALQHRTGTHDHTLEDAIVEVERRRRNHGDDQPAAGPEPDHDPVNSQITTRKSTDGENGSTTPDHDPDHWRGKSRDLDLLPSHITTQGCRDLDASGSGTGEEPPDQLPYYDSIQPDEDAL
jgi:hypothetical protein